MKSPVVLFNPRSAKWKHRIPMSILQVGASIHETHKVLFVDGNAEEDPLERISAYIKEEGVSIFGVTVMPGPQLKQAIPISKEIKNRFPEITIVWGGYFATNQHPVVLSSGFVDYVVSGPGDDTFPQLLQALEQGLPTDKIKNLIYLEKGEIKKTLKDILRDQDALPQLPYSYFNKFYPLKAVSYTHLTLPTTPYV